MKSSTLCRKDAYFFPVPGRSVSALFALLVRMVLRPDGTTIVTHHQCKTMCVPQPRRDELSCKLSLLAFPSNHRGQLKPWLCFKVVMLIADWSVVDPMKYLEPFLDVISSPETSGPITGVALTSLCRMLDQFIMGMSWAQTSLTGIA